MLLQVRQLLEVAELLKGLLWQVRQLELQLGQLVPLMYLPGEQVKQSVLSPPLQVRQVESHDKHCLIEDRYFPSAQERQLEVEDPEQVRQLVSQEKQFEERE